MKFEREVQPIDKGRGWIGFLGMIFPPYYLTGERAATTAISCSHAAVPASFGSTIAAGAAIRAASPRPVISAFESEKVCG